MVAAPATSEWGAEKALAFREVRLALSPALRLLVRQTARRERSPWT